MEGSEGADQDRVAEWGRILDPLTPEGEQAELATAAQELEAAMAKFEEAQRLDDLRLVAQIRGEPIEKMIQISADKATGLCGRTHLPPGHLARCVPHTEVPILDKDISLLPPVPPSQEPEPEPVQRRGRTKAHPGRRSAGSSSAAPGGVLKKRRARRASGPKPKPKPWSEKEKEHFKRLCAEDGPGYWKNKAMKLGTGRTGKALRMQWARDEGTIVDSERRSRAKSER